MAYKRKAKQKEDLRKNPDTVDTSMGKKFLKSGKVLFLSKKV